MELERIAGQRYLLERREGGEGAAERYLGVDEKLERAIVVWTLDAPERAPAREVLLSLARKVARPLDASFLQVLDIVPAPDRLSVILEAPPAGGAAPGAGMPARAAGTVVLDLGAALEEAAAAGLTAQRLARTYLHRDGVGTMRVDPVGIFFPAPGARPPAPPAALLADLLADLLEEPTGADEVSTAGDPEALRLHALAAEWRDAHAASDEALPAFTRDLRAALGASEPAAVTGVPVADANGDHGQAFDDEPTMLLEQWPAPQPESATSGRSWRLRAPRTRARTATPPRRRTRRSVRWSVVVPLVAALLVVALGTVGVFMARETPSEEASRGTASSGEPSGPPVEQPAAGEVTVGLAAQENSAVRVTVDGVVEFDGVLQDGERQLWEGNQRIQVWTNSGRTLLLSVNGEDLGPYSPAMGHPDWNRIDFGFWPGWPE